MTVGTSAPSAPPASARGAVGDARGAVALVGLGAAVNALAVTVPGSTPLMLGNAAAYALVQRRPAAFGFAAALVLGGIAGGPLWAAISLLSTVLCWALARHGSPPWVQLLGPLLPQLGWPLWRLSEPFSPGDALLAAAVLLLGQLAAALAARKLNELVQPTEVRKGQGLTRQLSARLGVGTTLPLSLLLLGISQATWQARADGQGEQLREAARDLRFTIERFLEARSAAIAFAADVASLPDRGVDLAALAARFPGFITLLVTDAGGQIVDFHAPGKIPFAGNVADRPYFRAPRDSGAPFLSDAFLGRGFGADMLVALSAPHRTPDGRFAGVVQAAVSLAELEARLRGEASGHGVELLLVDDQGQLLAGSLSSSLGVTPGSVVAGPPFEGTLDGPNGLLLDASGRWLIAETLVDGSHWRIRTLRPLDPLRAAAETINAGIALACIALLLLMSRLVRRFLEPQLAPLSGLINRMRGIDLSRPATLLEPDEPASSREYSALRDEFNAMLARIAELYADLQQAAADADRVNRELEQRVASRTTALREALQRAERLADAKAVFLANMSHELRTPLSAILGHAESALARIGSPQALEDALRVIDRNGRHLQGILNDILDASRLDAGQLPLERVAVSPLALAEEVRGLFAEKAREQGLDFGLQANWPLPASITADPLRLRQVLMNLVGNALKFTRHGEVWIELSAPDPQTLRIGIVDTGIGMDAATCERLFGAFEQADASTTRRFGGTGLGLYISRALVTRMGGEIVVESTPGVGSRFSVSLPIEAGARWLDGPEQAAPTAGAERPRAPRLSGRVLIAEDVEDLRTLIGSIVAETGAHTLMAADGASAVTLTQFEGADVVLLDMHMPIMDGVEAARRLREEGYGKPIIAITADVLPGDVARYLDAGCNAVLPKPIDRQALWRVLERHLPSARPTPARAAPAVADADPMAALMRKTRQRFAEALKDERSALGEADPARDGSDLRRRLHTLKGSAGTFGFFELGAAAAAAEAALRSGAVDWPAQHAALLAAIDAAIATVAAEAAEPV